MGIYAYIGIIFLYGHECLNGHECVYINANNRHLYLFVGIYAYMGIYAYIDIYAYIGNMPIGINNRPIHYMPI